MRTATVTYAVVAAIAVGSAAVAQNKPGQPSPPSGDNAQTTGQAGNPGKATSARQAPVGHRQPRAQDVPPAAQDNYGVRSQEDEAIDRKLRICRDC